MVRRVLLFLFFAHQVVAFPSGCWEAYGEALYWRPTLRSQTLTRKHLGTDPDVQRFQLVLVEPEHEWGFRLGGSYRCGPWESSIDYTRLATTDRLRVRGDLLTLVAQFFTGDGQADLDNKTTYWAVDGRIRHHWCCGRLDMSVHLGIRYLHIDFLQSETILGTVNIDGNLIPGAIGICSLDDEFTGVGALVGMSGQLDICSGLYLFARLEGLGGIGEHRPRQPIIFDLPALPPPGRAEFIATNEHRYHCVPGFGARLALGYERGFCCLCAKAEIGLECFQYFSLFGTKGQSPFEFGLFGPFVRAGLEF